MMNQEVEEGNKYPSIFSTSKTEKTVKLYQKDYRFFIFTTGCPKKNYTLFWRAVAPLNFELGIKVRGV